MTDELSYTWWVSKEVLRKLLVTDYEHDKMTFFKQTFKAQVRKGFTNYM